MIQGISHITLIVRDIEKTANLFCEIFDAGEIYSSGDNIHSLSKEKYLLINGIWLALMQGDPLKERSYNHIAFKVNNEDFGLYAGRIEEMGLETINDRKRIPGEGRSIYFYDYDNHLFELHAGTLEERLEHYRR